MSNALASLEGSGGLFENGYSLSLVDDHLVVNDVFYIDAAGRLAKGRLAAPLSLTDAKTLGSPKNHQMHWSGSAPHFVDGAAIPSLGSGGAEEFKIGDTTYVRHLSNKPEEGLPTFQLLVEHYVTLISGPAQERFGVTPKTGAIYDVPEDTSPFKVRDTFSARAEITDLNQHLAQDHIAVIGLGGTGSFVLDFVVKTPVHSIDAFDFDTFEVHNGFRSPGEVPFEMFGHLKANVYREKYEAFRHRLKFHDLRVGEGHAAYFAETTFAFVCIDEGEARAEICTMLTHLGVPFIDVGMGVEKEARKLDGLIRTTLFTEVTAERALAEVPLDKPDEEGAYRVFVQIAELNALNAALAVIRYKQLRGFYADYHEFYNSLYSIGLSKLVGES